MNRPTGGMEPNEPVGRLSGVQHPEALPDALPGALAGAPAGALAGAPAGPTLELVSGERPSFHDFYVASRDRVGRALAVTLRDADLAADSVDEAMARAYQRWGHVATLDNPAGWVYRVALNVARSRLRRLARRRASASGIVGEPPISDPSIERALAALSVEHRAVVVCRLLLGWSEAQTATALRIRPGTAKSRLHRAVAALETSLSHLRPEENR